MTDFQRTMVNPDSVCAPLGRYSQLARVKAGELLILGGQLAADGDGDIVGKGDVVAQVRQVYKNIGNILESAGATFGNVVQFTTYLVGRDLVEPFLEERNKIVDRLYPDDDFPPSTLLIVDGLQTEEMLCEVVAIAALP